MTVKSKPHTGGFYQSVKDADNEFLDSLLRRKNYWSRYPELRQMKNASKLRIASYISFAFIFLMSVTEFHGATELTTGCVVAALILTSYAIFAAFCFEMSVKTFKPVLMMPYMAVVMVGLSLYVLLLLFVLFCFLSIPPYHYFLLALNFFHVGVTMKVTYSFARCSEYLWQGFFTMWEICKDENLVYKLKINAPIDEDDDLEGKKKNKKNKRKGPMGNGRK